MVYRNLYYHIQSQGDSFSAALIAKQPNGHSNASTLLRHDTCARHIHLPRLCSPGTNNRTFAVEALETSPVIFVTISYLKGK